jgi:hypothetical protein
MKLILFACTMGALGLASPALGQVRAQDPQSVVRALQAAGYAAELGTDKVGDPSIRSGVAGVSFTVFFYNCTDHRECATVQLHSGYRLTKKVSLTSINEWNASQRFGRAFLDKEGDPIIQMDIDLDDGGISQALFADNLEFWSSIIGKFHTHIGYRP